MNDKNLELEINDIDNITDIVDDDLIDDYNLCSFANPGYIIMTSADKCNSKIIEEMNRAMRD